MLFQLLFRAFNVSKVPILPPLYEVLFADFVVSKDSDICWIFDEWMKDFCGVISGYPRKSVVIAGFYPRKSVIGYCKAACFSSSTYHIINKNNHIYILYDRLKYDGD